MTEDDVKGLVAGVFMLIGCAPFLYFFIKTLVTALLEIIT